MDYQNLRGLRGRVTQWTGKIVDQLLDTKETPGPGPTPPPRPQNGPNPPYNTHPQYGASHQYNNNPNPQYAPNPHQYGWSPQYGANFQQFPQHQFNGNAQNNYSQGGPPSPNPPPEDALRLRFNVFNVSQEMMLSDRCLHLPSLDQFAYLVVEFLDTHQSSLQSSPCLKHFHP